MKKIYFALLSVLFIGLSAVAQNDGGSIKIVLQDKGTKEAIPFANVVAFRDGVQVGVATTNMDGEAIIKPLAPGKYTVKGIYIGYQATEIKDVVVGEGKTAYVTIPLSNAEGVVLQEVEVLEYAVPLIDPDTKTGQTVTREEYQNLATKDINSVAATTAGVYQADEGKELNVRGSRATNTTYFVDGVKVIGTPNLPQQSIEQLNVITGGVPANYGDLTGGAISISTRGPQSQYFGGLEYITSQITDPYKYNSLGFSVGGPLYKKKDSTKRTIVGFFMSGQANHIKDPQPSFLPLYVASDEKLADLKETPLQLSPSGQGLVRRSEYVTKNDMVTQKYRPNSVSRLLSINGKVDFAPTPNTNISLGGFYEFNDNNGVDRNGTPQSRYYMFNAGNMPVHSVKTIRTNLSITQKFGNTTRDSKSQSLISNSFFRFLASYENRRDQTYSKQHGNDIFNYGYVGKFERTFLEENWAYNYQYAPAYSPGPGIPASNSYTYTGRREIGPTVFTPGDANPDQAAYTSQVIRELTKVNPQLVQMDIISSLNGLRNGDEPESIYNLYENFGYVYPLNINDLQEQWRIASSFNTDIKQHAITVGLEFDQRVRSIYNVSAPGLWTRMRLLANQHTQELDKSHPILNTQLSGTEQYYYFDYLYQEDKQTQFSERLLEKLGLPKNYTGFVNVDAVDPSILSLDMFSAEDLLGSADNTQLVAYQGYTHDGKLTKSQISVTDFLEKKDASGRHEYPIGSFRPIYASAYVMDKFDFKDIKFNVGLRVDRYDANQPVLKDKYAMHEIATINDLASMENLPPGFAENIPGNLPGDAKVYVAQSGEGGRSPLAIKGFRKDDQWYNAEGNEISDPTLIGSNGRNIPLFKDKANYEKNMSAEAFTNYKPQINFMPRVAFSFPISDVANFYAHYDILTQRPAFNAFNPLDYYFLNGTSQPLVTNPNQKPTRTVDYELGYEQVLNERKNASLKISTFYKEFRNLPNQKLVVGAYPKSYTQYDNIDFGTTKGISFVFDFRRTNGSRINANYTLQFAEGSGSNQNSGANLASSGQPNLRVLQPLDFDQRHNFFLSYDYRFGSKTEYRGPAFKTKKEKVVNVLSDVGFNITFMLGSGTPYTRWSTAVPTQGGNARSSIIGQINGSSKPWQFRSNLRIDKNIPVSWGSVESNNVKKANLNVICRCLTCSIIAMCLTFTIIQDHRLMMDIFLQHRLRPHWQKPTAPLLIPTCILHV